MPARDSRTPALSDSAPPDSAVLSGQFGDFEVFSEAVRDWNIEFRQLDAGAAEIEIAQAVCASGVQFSRVRFGRRYDQRGAAPSGLRTFALLENGQEGSRWCRREVDSDTLVCFPPSDEFQGISAPGFRAFLLTFPETLLAERAEELGHPSPAALLGASARILRVAPLQLGALREHLRAVHRLITGNPQRWQHPASRAAIEADLAERVTALVAPTRHVTGIASPPARERATQRAVEFIRANGPEPLTVGDLCRAARVSERVLEYAFRQHYGVSPRGFLKAFRLHGARRELRAADPQHATVGDVASRWGFWHASQFATDYRRFFGELPSETLKRR